MAYTPVSREDFYSAVNAAKQNGTPSPKGVQQFYDSIQQANARKAQQQNTALSQEDFEKQYTYARSRGVSGQQAIADLSSGKSFLNDALGNTNTEESYLDKAARELYDGKKGLGEKLIRAGAQVASFANTAKAGAARGLGNALEDIADAASVVLTALNGKEKSVYQIANNTTLFDTNGLDGKSFAEKVANPNPFNTDNLYQGARKTSITQAEWDSMLTHNKNLLAKKGIKTLADFNAVLASANEKMEAREASHKYNEKQGLGEKLNEKAMEWQEKAGEHAYVSTYGLGDEWGYGRLEKMVLELIPSLGGMMTDAAVSMVTGAPSLGVMSVRTFLDSYNNAMAKGASEDKANVYALAHSAVETLSEMIGGEGAVGFLYGAGLTDKAFEKAIGKIGNKTLQKIAYLVGSGASEGIEEVFSQISEPFTESILETDWGKSVKKLWGEQKFRDYMDAFLGGFLSSAVATGATNITSGAVNAVYGNGFTTVTDMQLAGINQEFGNSAAQPTQTQQTPAQETAPQASFSTGDAYQMLDNELNSYNNASDSKTNMAYDTFERFRRVFDIADIGTMIIDENTGRVAATVTHRSNKGIIVEVDTNSAEPARVIIPFTENGRYGLFDVTTDGGQVLHSYLNQGYFFENEEQFNNRADYHGEDQYVPETDVDGFNPRGEQIAGIEEGINDAADGESIYSQPYHEQEALNQALTEVQDMQPVVREAENTVPVENVAKNAPQKQQAQNTAKKSQQASQKPITETNPFETLVSYYLESEAVQPQNASLYERNLAVKNAKYLANVIRDAIKSKKYTVPFDSSSSNYSPKKNAQVVNEYLKSLGYQFDLSSAKEDLGGTTYSLIPYSQKQPQNTSNREQAPKEFPDFNVGVKYLTDKQLESLIDSLIDFPIDEYQDNDAVIAARENKLAEVDAEQKRRKSTPQSVSPVTPKNTQETSQKSAQVANDEFNTKVESISDSKTLEGKNESTEDLQMLYRRYQNGEISKKQYDKLVRDWRFNRYKANLKGKTVKDESTVEFRNSADKVAEPVQEAPAKPVEAKKTEPSEPPKETVRQKVGTNMESASINSLAEKGLIPKSVKSAFKLGGKLDSMTYSDLQRALEQREKKISKRDEALKSEKNFDSTVKEFFEKNPDATEYRGSFAGRKFIISKRTDGPGGYTLKLQKIVNGRYTNEYVNKNVVWLNIDSKGNVVESERNAGPFEGTTREGISSGTLDQAIYRAKKEILAYDDDFRDALAARITAIENAFQNNSTDKRRENGKKVISLRQDLDAIDAELSALAGKETLTEADIDAISELSDRYTDMAIELNNLIGNEGLDEFGKPKYKKLTQDEIASKLESLNNFDGTESPSQHFTKTDKENARKFLAQWFAYYGMKGDPDNAADREKVLTMITGIGEDTGKMVSPSTVNATALFTKLKDKIAKYEEQINELQKRGEEIGINVNAEIAFTKNKIADAKDKINNLIYKLDSAGVDIDALLRGDDENLLRPTEAMKLSLSDERSIMYALAALSDNKGASTIGQNTYENNAVAADAFADTLTGGKDNESGSLSEERKSGYNAENSTKESPRNGSEDADYGSTDEVYSENDTFFNDHVVTDEEAVADRDVNIKKYNKSANNPSYLNSVWKFKYKGELYYYSSGGNINKKTGERTAEYYRNILPEKVINTAKAVYDRYAKRLKTLNDKLAEGERLYNLTQDQLSNLSESGTRYSLDSRGELYLGTYQKYYNEKQKIEKILAKFNDKNYTLNKAVTSNDFPIEVRAALAGIDARTYGNITLKGIKDSVSQEHVKQLIEGGQINAQNNGISSQSQGFSPIQGISYGEGLRGENDQGTRSGTELNAEEIASSDAEAGTDLSKYGLTRAERAGLLGSLSADDRSKFTKVFGSRFTQEQFDAFRSGKFQIITDKEGNITYAGARKAETGSSQTSQGEMGEGAHSVFDAERRRNEIRDLELKLKNVFSRSFSVQDALRRIKNGANSRIEGVKSYYFGGKRTETGLVVNNQRELNTSKPTQGTERIAQKAQSRPDLSVVLGESIFCLQQNGGKKTGSSSGGYTERRNGKTYIFATNDLNLVHESRHDDCEFASGSDLFFSEHNESFEEYLENNLRNILGKDYDRLSNSLSKLYSEDEIPEELFAELAAVADTGMVSEWDSGAARFTEIGRKLKDNEAFKNFVSEVERYYEDGYASDSSFNASDNSKFKKLTPDDQRSSGLAVPGYDDSKMHDNESAANNYARNVFQETREAINNFDSLAFKGKRAYTKFTDNLRDALDGNMSVSDFYDYVSKEVKNDKDISVFFSPEIEGMLRQARDYYNRATANKDGTPLGRNVRAFRDSYAKAMRMITHQVSKANYILNNERPNIEKTMRTKAKNAKKHNAVVNLINSYNISAENMFRKLGGWAKSENNVFYRIANDISRAHEVNIKTRTQAHNFFNNLDRKSKEFRDFASGKTSSGVSYGGHEFSMIEAIETAMMYRTLSTKGEPKVRGFAIQDTDTRVNFEEYSDFSKLYSQLMKAINGNEIAKTYMQDCSDMFYDISKPLLKAYKEKNGVELFKHEKGQYYPVRYLNEDGSVFGQDENGGYDFKSVHQRIDGSTGTILIRPASETITRYIDNSSNYIAYANIGDRLHILNTDVGSNKGIGALAGELYGAQDQRWMDAFIKDINRVQEPDPDGINAVLAKARSRFAQGSLLFSVSTPLKQVPSYMNAMSVVSPKALRYAFIEGKKAIDKKTGSDYLLAAARRQGNIDPDVAQFLKSDWVNKAKNNSKIAEIFANANAYMDSATVNKVLQACAIDVKMKHKGIDTNSRAFNLFLEDEFNQATLATQPNYIRQARAWNARTNQEYIRLFSTFRTQQTQNFNAITEAYNEYRSSVKSGENTDSAKTKFVNTARGQIEAAVGLTVMNVIADALLHRKKKYDDDDDGEADAEAVARKLLLGTAENIAGTWQFGNEITQWTIDLLTKGTDNETSEFYGVNMGVLSAVGNFLDSITWMKSNPSYSNARYVLEYGMQLYGVPAANVYNAVNSMYMYARDIAGTNEDNFDDALKMLDAARKDYGNKLYNIYKENNTSKEEKLLKTIHAKNKSVETLIKDEGVKRLKSGKATDADVAKMLTAYTDLDYYDAIAETRKLHCELDTGIKYTQIDEALKSGSITKDQAISYWQEYGDKTMEEAKKLARNATYKAETGRNRNNAYTDFIKGEISEAEYRKILEEDSEDKVLDQTESIDEKVAIAQYEKKYGVAYNSLATDYRSGKITADQVLKARMAIKGETKQEATEYLEKQNFQKQYKVTYNDMKSLFREGKISAPDAVAWRVKCGASESSAQAWVKAQQVYLATGAEYESNGSTTYFDNYAQKESIGTNTFYDKYINEFDNPRYFGDVFNQVIRASDHATGEYYTKYGKVGAKQTGVIDILNENIANGKISYSLARKIWKEFCGYSDYAGGAWGYVKG